MYPYTWVGPTEAIDIRIFLSTNSITYLNLVTIY